MAEINQFGSAKPVRSGEGSSCAECEAMLTDALDETLSASRKAAFDRHIATCAECGQMLADAVRGASLLEMLKSPRPEPSSLLLDRILTQTSGLAHPVAVPFRGTAPILVAVPNTGTAALDIHAVVPVPVAPGNVLPFRPRPTSRFSFKAITHTMMQPRLAMTAAMAFFSITLTLNLTGVHLADLRTSDLSPSGLKHTFYHANASVVRYYENLRVVYELESRVNELKRTGDSDNAPADEKPASGDGGDKSHDGAKPRKAPKSGSGTSQRRSPLDRGMKLAGYIDYLPAPEGTLRKTVLALPANKSKVASREGDLV